MTADQKQQMNRDILAARAEEQRRRVAAIAEKKRAEAQRQARVLITLH